MSSGRDWRSFNKAWRNRASERHLDQAFRVLVRSFEVTERVVRRLEPLGILLAAVGLIVSIISFWIDYNERTVARKLRAWEIVTAEGPFSGGKAEAARYLLRNGGDLSGGRLREARWHAAVLEGVDLRSADLKKADLKSADLNGADLRLAELNCAQLQKATLLYADLRGADLSGANLKGAKLSGADLRGAKINRAELSGAQLRNSLLFEADLADTLFLAADLSEANLGKANLVRADFSRAILKGASFFRSDLRGANLQHAIVEKEQLAVACGDNETRLRHGVMIPMCSEVNWFKIR